MGEIVKFGDEPPKRKPDEKSTGLASWVWTCNACGNSTFQMIQGGAIRCANCNLHSTEMLHFEPNAK